VPQFQSLDYSLLKGKNVNVEMAMLSAIVCAGFTDITLEIYGLFWENLART